MSDKLFSPFELNDYIEGLDHEFCFDPDLNFFNDYNSNLSIDSQYYLEYDFNKYVSPLLKDNQETMSFIHLNIRSIKANGNEFNSYLETLDLSFDCIALTETWLKHDLDNTYSFSVNRTRKNRQGGGVSMLLKEGISYKIKENL